ncbi:MAG: hypothetical protein ACP5XB_06465 [Isosphaeraceae bacterium]
MAATWWTRAEDKPPASTQTRAQRAATPIEDKESDHWLCSPRQAQAEAERWPATRIVFVADNEADIHEVITAGMEQPHSI